MLYLSRRLKIAPKTPTIEELVVSLRLENEQLILWWLWSIFYHFSIKLIGKSMIWKMCSKKKFSDKNPWHIMLICAQRLWWLATHHVSFSPKHAIWSTKWLSNHLPGRLCAASNTTRAVRLTKCRSSGHATHRFTKFWSSRALCAPSGLCMSLQFVHEFVLHL